MTVTENDNDAVTLAIGVLVEAGFEVEQVRKTENHDDGVKFRLDIVAPSKYQWFDEQATNVRETLDEMREPEARL